MSKKEQEKRTYKIEFRADQGEGRTVEGYAATYRSVSNELWGFEEIIEPGAFDNADVSDVRALFNHNPDHILARSSSGTLSLEADEEGLRYQFEMPDTTLGRDLLVMMKRGDISQSSFAFTIKRDSWEEERSGPDGKPLLPLRHIHEVEKVYDVSPVTYPAYEQTTATARSLEQIKEKREAVSKCDDIATDLDIFILENQ